MFVFFFLKEIYVICAREENVNLDHSYTSHHHNTTSFNSSQTKIPIKIDSHTDFEQDIESEMSDVSMNDISMNDNDSDYVPEIESSDDEDEHFHTQEANHVKDRKCIVFESNLDELFNFCGKCGSPVISKTKYFIGAMVGYKVSCHAGHTYTWTSGPVERKQPSLNLMSAASIVTTGCTYSRFFSVANAMNLQLFSQPTYDKLQKEFFFPCIQEAWIREEENVREELKKEESIIVSGDGRCDSPGHTAKYCSYTLMDTSSRHRTGSNKIVAMELVQVFEVSKVLIFIFIPKHHQRIHNYVGE